MMSAIEQCIKQHCGMIFGDMLFLDYLQAAIAHGKTDITLTTPIRMKRTEILILRYRSIHLPQNDTKAKKASRGCFVDIRHGFFSLSDHLYFSRNVIQP